MKHVLRMVGILCVLGSLSSAAASELPPMTVWKTPTCGCCGKWVEHIRAAGFEVEVKDVEDLDQVKRMSRIPERLASCHTAVVGGYKIEGHVPASDVKRLLETRPEVEGIAVPGMPLGSPGMEFGEPEPYDVISFSKTGATEVFSSHK